MSSALRTRRSAGSNPVRKANHQRVGESGRPYLPWKQGIVCSNHTTLTIVIDPWRNRNAAVCKTVMSRGSTGRVIQDKQTDGLRKEITFLCSHADVANRCPERVRYGLVFRTGC